MENVLTTVGLTKRYGGRAVVNGVALSVQKGDIYGFIGRNGAGKTTLIRMVTGLSSPNAGKIELFGQPTSPSVRNRLGSVIESPALFPRLTAEENLRIQSRLKGVEETEIPRILDLIGLSTVGRKKTADFSLGMKQRLSIGLSLIGSPEFLLLDEPINGLDPEGIVEVRTLLHSLNRDHGITILISSHILGELEKLATRFGVINNGVLIDEFTREELESRCKARLVLCTDDNARASALLSSQFGCTDIHADGNSLFIGAQGLDAAALNKALVTAGFAVSSLYLHQNDLEDYFMQLLSERSRT